MARIFRPHCFRARTSRHFPLAGVRADVFVVRSHKTNSAPFGAASRHKREHVAPMELATICGRMFHKDVAPQALGKGRARQSSARRAFADQLRRGRLCSPSASEGVRHQLRLAPCRNPDAVCDDGRASPAGNHCELHKEYIGFTRPESSSSRRRAASATPSSVASSSLCGGNESSSHAATDPRLLSGNSAKACLISVSDML